MNTPQIFDQYAGIEVFLRIRFSLVKMQYFAAMQYRAEMMFDPTPFKIENARRDADIIAGEMIEQTRPEFIERWQLTADKLSAEIVPDLLEMYTAQAHETANPRQDVS